ncbi:MFS transporter [Actinoallomurus soli]|uniref:MFS transporter n=1 Tax=Actinoallomurus soli TaxID=2952535 RepID=UPI0020938EF1|nr:MFS transporter [Actinoallomurus soli]MCO5966908.1 MFS transporter [Actinoallomurus soli]
MTVQTPVAAPPDEGHPRRTLILALMAACATMTVALVAAINLAVPQLSASSLRPSSAQLLWIVDAYVIVFACLLIPAGAFGDRYGRRGALLGGLAVFAAGCVASALAPDAGALIAGRAVTGLGAALVMPATLSLTVQAFPARLRGQAIASWTAATGIAGIIGNIGGGLVLEYLPWQGLFWAVAPIVLVLLALCARVAPRSERHPADLDVIGCALVILAFVALLYGIIEGPERGWSSGPVLGAFAVSALVFGVFTAYALCAEHPLVDPRIFAVARLRAGVSGITVTFFGLFALFFVNAQYLQYVKGFSPLLTGVAIGPLALGMMVVSRRSVALAARFGERCVVVTGLLAIAAGLGLLSTVGPRSPYALYVVFLLLMSTGMGLSTPPLSTSVIGALPPKRAGLGSGLNGAAREVGSALGVAVLGTILSTRFTAELPAGVHAHTIGQALAASAPETHAGVVSAFTDAMAAGYRVIALIVLASALVVTFWYRPTEK